MNVDLGFNIQANVLFDAMKQSPIMSQKGYNVLYTNTYTTQQNGHDGYGLCYENYQATAYIHVRIINHWKVSSFEYTALLDNKKRVADKDIQDLLLELKKKFSKTTP